MNLDERRALREDLTRISTEIAASMRAKLLAAGSPERARAEKLHADERVGEGFEVWTDLLARRGAVLWVLKSVYVRVLEDRGLLVPGRVLDAESQGLFEHLAPNLGPTAYLRWVYRDLAAAKGGLPELFAPQPAEIAAPSDAMSQKLLDLWRKRDPDSGVLAYRFDEEHFDGRLMGDLYQDLDPVVKKRYALLQTPDFVIDFILDETLTPAIAEWGVEAVRVLDPACGSGHFLLAAFKRLVAGMREKFSTKPVREVVEDVLGRVVGIDLNDYACALARARLVMTALEMCGERDLGAGAGFHPHIYWADALEQVERDDLGQLGLFANGKNGKPKALLTRPEVRVRLRPILKAGFHVVVGNPPYITEKDASRRRYHMETQGRRRRYLSAAKAYSLGAPFTERMLQLAIDGGFVGEITTDSFMKREFGKPLIQDVLAHRDLYKVVSTAGAYIPGHGTPTVILFARNQTPREHAVRAVMGKRGEPGKPADPAKAKVWSSIIEGHTTPGYENEFISVGDVARTMMGTHPWSIGGGGAAALTQDIEGCAATRLQSCAEAIGFTVIIGEDEAYIFPGRRQFAWPTLPIVVGEEIRDWALDARQVLAIPFVPVTFELHGSPHLLKHLWSYRSLLWERIVSGSTTMRDANRQWFDVRRLARDKFRTPLSIAFAFKATHNHFVLDRGDKVFKQTAPVIKLPAGASEEQHLVLLAQLNSSTGEFWVKQTMQSMGAQGVNEGIRHEKWDQFFERDGTKLQSFPLIAISHPQLESFARHLDTLARERVADSPRSVLDQHAPSGAAALRVALNARRERDLDRLYRMVGLQEELDWLCYRLYGIDPEGADVRDPEHVPPIRPGLRPFEITLAQEDAERRAALARGEEPDEQPTAWFERHGWEPVTDLAASLSASATSTWASETSSSASAKSTWASETSSSTSATSTWASETSSSTSATPTWASETSSSTSATSTWASETPSSTSATSTWASETSSSTSATSTWASKTSSSTFFGTKDANVAATSAIPSEHGVSGLSSAANGSASCANVASASASPTSTSTSATPGSTSATPAIVESRLARTAASRDLSLVEQPTYKRRWYRPDHAKEEREAMDLWLADRLEAWAKARPDPFTVRQAAAALRADPAVLAVAELLAGRPDFDLDTLVAERLRTESVPGNKHHVFKPEGLIKRAAWEKTWEMQHLEDAGKLPLGDDGKPVPIPVPPKYERSDYLKAEHWALRGKLDVPKERFIAFTEAPPEVAEEPLFGWAGWTARERARVLLGLDEKAESAGVKVPDRYGLLYGVWFLLPYVAWESPQAASDFRADVRSQVGDQGVTEEMLAEWAASVAARKPGKAKKASGGAAGPARKRAPRKQAEG